MKEISIQEASIATQKLYYKLKETIDCVYDKIGMGSCEFIIILSKNGVESVENPGNIYIDVDVYVDEDGCEGEFTVNFGFTHSHYEFAGNDIDQYVAKYAKTILDIVEHRIAGYYFISTLDNKRTGFYPYVNEEDIYGHFLIRDLEELYYQNHSYDERPTVEELLEINNTIENKDNATLYYVLFGDDVKTLKFYIDEE